MKRILLLVAAVAVVLVTAVPGAVGLVAERQHQRLIEHLAQGPLVEARYQRAWFTSRATHRYRVDHPELRRFLNLLTPEPQAVPEILVENRVHHGPVPALTGGHALLGIGDMSSTAKLLASSGQTVALPGTVSTRLRPDGTTRVVYRAAGETRPVRDGLQWVFGDIDIDLRVALRGDRFDLNASSAGLELTDGLAVTRVGPATIDARQELSPSGLWTGELDVVLQSLSLPELSLGRQELSSQVTEIDGVADVALQLSAMDLRVDGLAGDTARLDLTVHQAGAAALAGLMREAETGFDGLSPAARQTLLTGLFRPGPRLTLITLRMPTPDVDLEADAVIEVAPGTGPEPRELALGVEGDTRLVVPETLMRRIAASSPDAGAAIGMMEQTGLLAPEDGRYRIELAYAGGLLTVNGFPVPLPPL